MTKLEIIKQKAIEAKKLADRATPGPWMQGSYAGIHGAGYSIGNDNGISGMGNSGFEVCRIADPTDNIDKLNLAFIKASRDIVPDQANTILKLCAALERAIGQRGDAFDHGNGQMGWQESQAIEADWDKQIEAILSEGATEKPRTADISEADEIWSNK